MDSERRLHIPMRSFAAIFAVSQSTRPITPTIFAIIANVLSHSVPLKAINISRNGEFFKRLTTF